MSASTKRTRTFSWDDPATGIDVIRTMTGLDYLQAMKDGLLPLSPLAYTLDFSVVQIAAGKVIFRFTPQEFHYNPIGTVHGGVITSILDSAMGCTLHSLLPVGVLYTTLELKVNFLKAITIKTGSLQAISKVIHKGGRTALLEAQLTNDAGIVFAHATSTCLLLPS